MWKMSITGGLSSLDLKTVQTFSQGTKPGADLYTR